MLSLRNLLIFQAVAQTGNFTKAAQQLFLTQSAVSHSIREMESYAGSVLFDRLPKGVQLTAGGRLFLEQIQPLLAACDALDKQIGHLEAQAPLKVVSSITIASFWLPRFLQEFAEKMPETPVQVQVVSAAQAVQTLQSGGADIAFVEGVRPQGPFLYRKFARYALQVVCSPDYPLPSRRLETSQLCTQKLLLREPGSAIRDVLDSQLRLLGYTAYPTWVSVNSTALAEAAKAGLGIAVLPQVLVERELDAHTLIALEVEGLHLENDMIAVWHREKYQTAPLRALLESIPQQHEDGEP